MGVVRTGLTKTVGQSNAQVVNGSLRFSRANSQYLTRTPSTVGNRRTWTISCWIKFSKFSTENDGDYRAMFITANNFNLEFWPKATLRISGSQTGDSFNSLAKYRDTSAWYHLVVACDTTSSSGDDRFKIYMNGVRQANNPSGSGYQGYTAIAQNYETEINNIQAQYIGCYFNLTGFVDLYLSNFYLIDGQALDPSYFGFTDPLTNTWRPKKFNAFNNPNNGTTWSNLTTASSGGFEVSYPKTNLFDGVASNANRANLNTVGASIDIDFSSNPIQVKNTISIWSGKLSLSYSINGGAYVTYSDAVESFKDIPFTGTLTSLSLKRDDEGAGASAIKIDGYILLDGK